jgi:hypothetical protein
MNLKKFSILNLLVAFLFLFSSFETSLSAAVPKLITYQGLLKNSAGSFLTGTYAMTFRVYGASTGGSALWSETQSSVSATSGRFSVQLGSVTAINLDFSQDYWLSVQVGSDAEMTPRQKLTSVGYALMAEQVVNGFTQGQHDSLSHKNVEGVKDNTINIAKTNFKLDAYSAASANSMGDMVIDTFNDATGIYAAGSSNYTWRGTPNYDVIATPGTGGGIDSNTVLMLHMNGTNGSTTFTDSSASGKSATANGSAQITTAQSKFASSSGTFNGTNSYVTVADSADWDFGTGDFTVDYWVRFNSLSNQWNDMIDINGYANGLRVEYDSVGQLVYVYIANSYTGFSTSFSTGVWYHIAVVRTGNSLKLFKDGTQVGSNYDVTGKNITGGTDGVFIGAKTPAGLYLNGWMDEVRISKGIARWTANFTVPAAEYYAPTTSPATVVSAAWAEPIAPTEAMIVPDETLNTGSITYYVSRDNGTTWTAATKNTVTNISSQPTGTQLKWKAVINGNAELNAIAVAV